MALDSEVNHVWNRQLDIYGRVKREFRASSLGEDVRPFIPFLYQGQYFDFETGLCYNRFRYYSPETGLYISQDPIGLAGNNPNLYAYVKDSNWWVDILELRKYVVYQAYELDEKGKRTGKIYTGRTSGDDDMSVDQILKRRHSNHHRNLEPLTSVYEIDNYGAVRGGEQHYLEEARKLGIASDQINGISERSDNKEAYKKAFVDPQNNKTGKLDDNLKNGCD